MDNSSKPRGKSRKGNNANNVSDSSSSSGGNNGINNRNDLNDGVSWIDKKCNNDDVRERNASADNKTSKENVDNVAFSRDEIVSNLMAMGFPELGSFVYTA